MIPPKMICHCGSGKRFTACCGNSEKKANLQMKRFQYVTVPHKKLELVSKELAAKVKSHNEMLPYLFSMRVY